MSATRLLRLAPVHRSALGSMSAGFALQGALLVSGVLSARVLGPENRGYLALLILVPTIVAQIGSHGLPLALTYFVAKCPDATGLIVRSVARPAIAQVVGLSAIHAATLWLLLRDDPADVRQAGAYTLVIVPASLLQQYGLAILQGRQRYAAFNVLRLLPSFLYAGTLLLIVVGLRIGSLGSVTAAWASCYAMAAVATGVASARAIPPIRTAAGVPGLREVARFGIKGFLGSTSPIETLRVDQAVIGLFISPVALGLYVSGLAFTNLPRFVAQSIGSVAYPHVAAKPTRDAARSAVWRFVWLTVFSCTALVVVMGITAPFFVPWFFGSEFGEAIPIMRILLVGALCFGVRRVLGDGVRGLGDPMANTVAEVASWAWLAPALALLAPRMGAEGVAWSLSTASAFSLLVLLGTAARTLWPNAVRGRLGGARLDVTQEAS